VKADETGTENGMPRILVADDNRQFAELLRVTLENAGYEVVTAYSGIAAVTASDADGFDVAVLDVLLPGLSGDAVAERLRTTKPRLPILLMTGAYGDPFAKASGLPVLHKPFAQEDLVKAVGRLLERRKPFD
jgi:DNA-binding response OmpR family regulator